MPLPTSCVGASTAAIEHDVDERWTMAYAAGIGDLNECYLDTTRAAGVVAHPLFPVCLEWPVVLDARGLVPRDLLPADELIRGVHATHDLHIHRLVRPGDRLRTTATIEGIERRRPGAYEVLRLDTVDAAGELVCVTRMGSLFLGVGVDGDDRPAPDPAPDHPGPGSGATPALGSGPGPAPGDLPCWTRGIEAQAAHVYTECARIWNPIHTDPAVAQAAGLPGIILHGTAVLAMGISHIVDAYADGDPARVRRISGRFAAMVTMPSTIEIRVLDRRPGLDDDARHDVWFEIRNADDQAALRSGRIVIAAD